MSTMHNEKHKNRKTKNTTLTRRQFLGKTATTASASAVFNIVPRHVLGGKNYIDRTRLKGLTNVYASPVGADDRIYLSDRSGVTLVIKRSKELKVIAKNELGEQIVSSPALVGNQLFLRGRTHLYSITQEKDLN